jgi:hypothetical protein
MVYIEVCTVYSINISTALVVHADHHPSLDVCLRGNSGPTRLTLDSFSLMSPEP